MSKETAIGKSHTFSIVNNDVAFIPSKSQQLLSGDHNAVQIANTRLARRFIHLIAKKADVEIVRKLNAFLIKPQISTEISKPKSSEVHNLNALKALDPNEQAGYLSEYMVTLGVLPDNPPKSKNKPFLDRLTFSMRAVAVLGKRYTDHITEAEKAKAKGNFAEAEAERKKALNWGEAYWNTDKGKILKKRIESPIYEAIDDIYNLAASGLSKVEFLKQQLLTADKAVMLVVNDTGEQGVAMISLLDEVKRATNPVDFIKLLTRTDIKPELRFELWRKLFMALDEANHASLVHLYGVKDLLTQHTAFFNEDVFEGKPGETKTYEFTVLHEADTNKVVWVKGVHSEVEKKQLLEHSEHNVREETHAFRFRDFDGIGMVLSLPRDKKPESGLNKRIYKSLIRDTNDSQYSIGEVVPEDVTDNAGHTIVVFNAKSIDDELMSDALNVVEKTLAARHKIDLSNDEVLQKHFEITRNGKKENSSPEHNFIKMKFYPPGSRHRIESIEYQIKSFVDFLNDMYYVGEKKDKVIKYDGCVKKISERNGPAEELFKRRQSRTLLPHYIQKDAYDPTNQHKLLNQLLELNLANQDNYANSLLNSSHPSRRSSESNQLAEKLA